MTEDFEYADWEIPGQPDDEKDFPSICLTGRPASHKVKSMAKKHLNPTIRKAMSEWGRKGGKNGSREDKVRAGKLGYKALREKRLQQAKARNANAAAGK